VASLFDSYSVKMAGGRVRRRKLCGKRPLDGENTDTASVLCPCAPFFCWLFLWGQTHLNGVVFGAPTAAFFPSRARVDEKDRHPTPPL
jgi:hypothetical protein